MTVPKVVIDSAILVTPRLSALPIELIPIAGRQIGVNDLKDVHALLTRTVTRVDAHLLQDSRIGFVGTASAGTDHIDTRYLSEHAISLASAAGCNAAAVADYVLDAIYQCGRLESLISGATVGLVGYGAVGRQLATRLVRLGAIVKVYDPLIREAAADVHVCSLSEALSCSIVSLHAALHSDEPYPSFQMLDSEATAHVMSDAVFINAGRGGLVTEEALHRMGDRGVTLVLDAWPDEPNLPSALLSKVAFATPHIAGYTATSKTNATDFLIEPLKRALNLTCALHQTDLGETRRIVMDLSEETDIGGLMTVMAAVTRLAQDDSEFRQSWTRSPSPDNFESQRTNYRLRDQYSDVTIRVERASTKLQGLLSALGFDVVT